MYRPHAKRRRMACSPSQTTGAVMIDRIREIVARYLSGDISADELEVQLPDGWEMDRDGDEDARRLVLRIIGYVAEFQNGDLNEADFVDRLRLAMPSARTYWIDSARISWLEQAKRTLADGQAVSVTPTRVQQESGISRAVEFV
jgi:hypothetical protein